MKNEQDNPGIVLTKASNLYDGEEMGEIVPLLACISVAWLFRAVNACVTSLYTLSLMSTRPKLESSQFGRPNGG